MIYFCFILFNSNESFSLRIAVVILTTKGMKERREREGGKRSEKWEVRLKGRNGEIDETSISSDDSRDDCCYRVLVIATMRCVSFVEEIGERSRVVTPSERSNGRDETSLSQHSSIWLAVSWHSCFGNICVGFSVFYL
jgi:hypothetical protein